MLDPAPKVIVDDYHGFKGRRSCLSPLLTLLISVNIVVHQFVVLGQRGSGLTSFSEREARYESAVEPSTVCSFLNHRIIYQTLVF